MQAVSYISIGMIPYERREEFNEYFFLDDFQDYGSAATPMSIDIKSKILEQLQKLRVNLTKTSKSNYLNFLSTQARVMIGINSI